MIKAVLLDVDNTLLDFDACSELSARVAFDALSLRFRADVMPTFKRINDGLWQAIERGELTREGLLAVRWKKIFDALGIEADAASAEEVFIRTLEETAVPVDGAEDLLRYLSGKYTVCVASNAPSARQMKRLTAAGLRGYVDRMFVSGDIGFAKPRREFFDACFAALNPVLPCETVMIGDSLTADICGGRAYGLPTVWYNRDGIPERGDEADFTVHSLREIMGIL